MDPVKAGSTNITTYFQLRNVADGTDATGKTITDFDLTYTRSGAASAAKVDATALSGAGDAHSDNTMIEVDATNQPGLYRVDWPDAAFASGVREVVLTVKHTDIQTSSLRVTLDAPVNVVSLSDDQTAADNLELDYDGTGYAKTNSTVGTVTTLTGHTAQTGDSFARLGAPAGASVSADNAAIKAETALILTDTNAILVDTADIQPKLGTPAGADMSADIAAVKAETALILTDTNAILIDTAEIGAAGAGLTDLGGMSTGMKAEVNTEMVDVITVDTISELAVAAPAATPTLASGLMFLYMEKRNKNTQTATVKTVFNDAGTAIATAAITDASGTTTKAEYASA